jgi:glycosyltransferase involved in cell wall biosynthesis
MQLSVSVIIPCFNVENYIREAVNSIFQQNEIEIELICVDDCSEDRTFEILQEIKSLHPLNVFIYKNEINQGAAFSRNRGLESASGTYIQFLDADDLLLPGKISYQLNLCKGESNLPGFIVGDIIKEYASGEKENIIAECDNVWLGLMKTRLGCTCSNLWNKEALMAVGGFDINLKSSQEGDLMFRLLKNGEKIIYDYMPLTIVRERKEGSISKLNRGSNWKRYVQLRCDIITYLQLEGKLTADSRNAFNQILFDAIRYWYPYSPDEAFETYRKYLPANFVPVVSTSTSKNYVRLFRLLGFRMTEKIKILRKS